MRSFLLLSCLALAACQPADDVSGERGESNVADPPSTPLRPASPERPAASGSWAIDGGRLAYTPDEQDGAAMTIACQGGAILVSLPGVAPIGSEERLSFGGGGEIETLVVSQPGSTKGVEGLGPAPEPKRLEALLRAGPGASYGATALGPVAPVPDDLARKFVAACAR